MAFLRRDFTHPEHSPRRKRDRAITLFYQADGRLVAAYSYNTALAVVVPDAGQVAGVRIYINRTAYSKGSTEHLASVVQTLIGDYGRGVVDVAGDAYAIAVGTTANDLPGLCKPTLLPNFVRERPITGRVHLTMADKKRYIGRGQNVHASSDGTTIDVMFLTRDGAEHMVRVTHGVTDICPLGEDWYGDDCTDHTLSPQLYGWLIATQAKLAALSEARGSVYRQGAHCSYLDMTYSGRPGW